MARSSSLRLSRRVWTQLAILASITVISIAVMAFGFIKVPALLGVGRYTVKVVSIGLDCFPNTREP